MPHPPVHQVVTLGLSPLATNLRQMPPPRGAAIPPSSGDLFPVGGDFSLPFGLSSFWEGRCSRSFPAAGSPPPRPPLIAGLPRGSAASAVRRQRRAVARDLPQSKCFVPPVRAAELGAFPFPPRTGVSPASPAPLPPSRLPCCKVSERQGSLMCLREGENKWKVLKDGFPDKETGFSLTL